MGRTTRKLPVLLRADRTTLFDDSATASRNDAFPADSWAAFAVHRLAEDLRCGGLSRWSEPPALEALSAELSGLREGVSRALAQEAPQIWEFQSSSRVAAIAEVGLCAHLRTLAAAAADRADGGCRHLPPALRNLAASTIPHQRGHDGSLPRWCNASSLWEPSLGEEVRVTAAWAGTEDVGTAVMAYCSALQDCLAVKSPVHLVKPHRLFDSMLPSHIRDTTAEINDQVLVLREALLAASGAIRDGTPYHVQSVEVPSRRTRTVTPPPCPRQPRSHQRWGAGWGCAAAVAASVNIRELLARLGVQAAAGDTSSGRAAPFYTTIQSASAAVARTLERFLGPGISCDAPLAPLQMWFSCAEGQASSMESGVCSSPEVDGPAKASDVDMHMAVIPKPNPVDIGNETLPLFIADLHNASIETDQSMVSIRGESHQNEEVGIISRGLQKLGLPLLSELEAPSTRSSTPLAIEPGRGSEGPAEVASLVTQSAQKLCMSHRDPQAISCCWAFLRPRPS
jgi:hypothetical protein